MKILDLFFLNFFFLLKNKLKCDIYLKVIKYKNKLKTTINLLIGLYFSLVPFPLAAGELPFRDISPGELTRLQRGEQIFRVLDSYKDISLQAGDQESTYISDLLKKIKPNFVAEILMVIPVDQKKDNLDYIRSVLKDVTLFDDIPYYSKRNDKWYPLYEDTRIISEITSLSGQDTVLAYHKMKPFKPQETTYEYSLQGNTFLFESRNSSNIYYKNFKAVKKGNLFTLLWVRDEGDRLIVYGVGGASAFTFFGIFGERMDNSFIGRMEAFFTWFDENYIRSIINNN